MERAPFFDDIAEGPDDGNAWWLTARDGMRVRIAAWARQAEKGTILLFPGRSEYAEKYGRTAADLAACGFATIAIDWRGQGLADRMLDDPMVGHVHAFQDYQSDVAALLDAAEVLDLPRPFYLLAHSMGGCIGLRAVMEGLPVAACVFSGPMWGIQMADALRPVAWSLSWSSRKIGMGHAYAPGTEPESYVLSEPFETNKLTRDRDMYDHMIRHLEAHPELGLGGPSLRWLHEALSECRALRREPSPPLPCLTLVGDAEEIVDVGRIHERMARWPGGKLETINAGRHEVLMEDAATRDAIARSICDFFDGKADTPSRRDERSGTDGQGPTPPASSHRQRRGSA